jgi:hypothetical protein
LVLAKQRHHYPLGGSREGTGWAAIFKNQIAVPLGFEGRRYQQVNQGLLGPVAPLRPVRRRFGRAPGTLTFGPAGSRYPPPAAGPLDADIRRGNKIPRTTEPA